MNIGDYVRFKDKRKNTYIRKIIETPEDNRYGSIYIDKEANYSNCLSFKNVIKSSPNIIDLIEDGDYVNGMIVKDINDVAGFVIVNTSSISENTIFSYNIESIVTKEQFEAIKYEIK